MLLLYCLLYAMYLHSIYQVDSIILPLSLQDIEEFSFGGYSSVQCVETWPPWMGNTFTLVVLCIQYLLPLVVLPLVHSQVPPPPRLEISAANRSIGSTTGCTITEKAPTRH